MRNNWKICAEYVIFFTENYILKHYLEILFVYTTTVENSSLTLILITYLIIIYY